MSNYFAQIKVKATGKKYLATFLDTDNGYEIYAEIRGKEVKFTNEEVEIIENKE